MPSPVKQRRHGADFGIIDAEMSAEPMPSTVSTSLTPAMTSDVCTTRGRLKRTIADGKHPRTVVEAEIAASEQESGCSLPDQLLTSFSESEEEAPCFD